jgi:hypothetical protein
MILPIVIYKYLRYNKRVSNSKGKNKMKREGYYVNLKTDKDKNLIIILNKKTASFIKDELFKTSSNDALWTLLEDHFENGLEWIKPEEIGALTDAPIFSDNVVRNDLNELIAIDSVWYDEDYMIVSPIVELFETGKTIFKFDNDFE